MPMYVVSTPFRHCPKGHSHLSMYGRNTLSHGGVEKGKGEIMMK